MTDSYVLASNSQKLEQTFYNLKEALKYQNPKVVLIQTTVLTGDSWKTEDGDYRVYSNLDGMRFSLNKLNAITAQRPANDYLNTLFSLFRNHEKWKSPELIGNNLEREESIIRDDYRGFSPSATEMGEEIKEQFIAADKVDYSNYEVSEYDIHYLREIKKLSEKRGFKVIYLMSPKYPDLINPTYRAKAEILNKAISSLGHKYLDFNLRSEAIGIKQRSFENGFIGYQHTSNFGAAQVSVYLANYLKDSVLKQSQLPNVDPDWKARMKIKSEYYVFNDHESKDAALFRSEEQTVLLDSIEVQGVEIYKIDSDGHYKFIIRFNEDLDIDRLRGLKFFFHLYPGKSDDNIKTDRKEYGYENFDFIPNPLPQGKNKYYVIREIETEIIDIERIDLGLFNSKTKERSEQFSIKNIRLQNK